MKMEHSVPKRRYIKFRRRGITQKKAQKIITIKVVQYYVITSIVFLVYL